MAVRTGWKKISVEENPHVAGDSGLYAKQFTIALSPAEVAANTCAEQEFDCADLAVGDIVTVNKPTAQAGLGIAGFRAGAGHLYINFNNPTAAGITPTAAEVYKVLAIRQG